LPGVIQIVRRSPANQMQNRPPSFPIFAHFRIQFQHGAPQVLVLGSKDSEIVLPCGVSRVDRASEEVAPGEYEGAAFLARQSAAHNVLPIRGVQG
jgi:hypothetical protein